MNALQEKFVFPTLGREELNLSISPMALSVAEIGDFTKDYGTYIGDLKVIMTTAHIENAPRI